MLKRFKEIRENKKGFTLVELIVVLAILAILAALLIPALTGYIEKAKDKEIIAKTRQVVMAVQTIVDEQYAINSGVGEINASNASAVNVVIKSDKETKYYGVADTTAGASAKDLFIKDSDIAALADVAVTATAANAGGLKDVKLSGTSKGKVSELVYFDGSKYCKYTADGKYAVTTTSP